MSSSSAPQSRPPFRPEAVAAQTSQFLGGIRIATAPSLTLAAAAAVTLVLALGSFAVFGQATRKAQVAGVLLPVGGLIPVNNAQGGRVLAIHVHEGDIVEAGQPLASLELGGYSDANQGSNAELIAQSLQARQTALTNERRSVEALPQLREQALNMQMQSLRSEAEQARGELEATLKRQQLAQASFERDQKLAQQGFLSSAQLQTRQEAALDLQVREREARRNLEGLQRQIQTLQADISTARLQASTQLAQLDRSEASLRQERTELNARSRVELLSPMRAMVGAINSQPGQTVPAAQTVLNLVPIGSSTKPKLEAQLFAASRTAGFIEPGQEVWLRLHAFPYQKFGMFPGKVVAISRTPVAPQDLPTGMASSLLALAAVNEPLYRVTVALNSSSLYAFYQNHELKSGMTFEADVIQDQRSILEWAIEPLIAAGTRMKQ